ncbi:MAG TPA: redox-sensing transcriptional repressor Rex [Verrucomicrobiales bacterium]|nr:redox-sensing transcriptional repressor Rex [Verrucomicrobiales bacterium]
MEKIAVPRKSIYRLSIYQRCLQRLVKNGVSTVSSQTLAKAAGVKPTQLRKDLAYFGQFGTRGLGYNVATLSDVLTGVLGTASFQPVILVGVGNLGSALLRYGGFNKEGFDITAAFDIDPDKPRDPGILTPIRHQREMAPFIRTKRVKMAILAIPSHAAQGVANEMVDAGVQAILNFSPTVLHVPGHVTVNNVDLALELENLSFFVR